MKIEVVENGRDIATIGTLTEEVLQQINEIRKQYKIIGSACVVTKRKGLHQVINALASLKNYAFLLIGDGPELKNLKKLSKQHNVEERCFFIGKVENAILYYKYFDFYVMSSYAEGLPLALLEAAGNGIPTLCSDIEIHRELFSNREVAFFELDNKASLQQALLHLTSDYSDFSNKIKARYLKQYTNEIMAQNYLKIYKSLIQN